MFRGISRKETHAGVHPRDPALYPQTEDAAERYAADGYPSGWGEYFTVNGESPTVFHLGPLDATTAAEIQDRIQQGRARVSIEGKAVSGASLELGSNIYLLEAFCYALVRVENLADPDTGQEATLEVGRDEHGRRRVPVTWLNRFLNDPDGRRAAIDLGRAVLEGNVCRPARGGPSSTASRLPSSGTFGPSGIGG